MNIKVKLVDYQVQAIRSAIDFSSHAIEDTLLDKYNAYSIADLNATDFDKIMSDIQDWHLALIKKAK